MNTAITRLTFDELSPELQGMLGARVARLGYLGEFFRYAGHQPDILASFLTMTEALKRALPDRLTEVGALTVATLMENDYERHQHEQLCCKLGFGEAWVAAVERVAPDDAPDLSDAERAAQRLVVAVIARKGKSVGAELDAAIARIGVDAALALLFLVGRYVTHALIVNALDLAPPVPSIFAEAVAA